MTHRESEGISDEESDKIRDHVHDDGYRARAWLDRSPSDDMVVRYVVRVLAPDDTCVTYRRVTAEQLRRLQDTNSVVLAPPEEIGP